ncbi:MAG: hypothetical protein ACJ8HJ_27280 [Massilia sp.]|jgi:hypothetical protein
MMGHRADVPHADGAPPPGFLASAGELGRLIHAYDWSATPLGSLDTDFIALSGYGQPEDRARSLGAGFCAHLVKPPAPPELAALLESLAQRRTGELAEDGA